MAENRDYTLDYQLNKAAKENNMFVKSISLISFHSPG